MVKKNNDASNYWNTLQRLSYFFFSVNVYGIKFGTIAKLRERFYLMFEGKEICAYCIISCF